MTDHLDIIRAFQAWRTSQDERTLDEIQLTPRQITEAIDALIAEVEARREESK